MSEKIKKHLKLLLPDWKYTEVENLFIFEQDGVEISTMEYPDQKVLSIKCKDRTKSAANLPDNLKLAFELLSDKTFRDKLHLSLSFDFIIYFSTRKTKGIFKILNNLLIIASALDE